VIFRVPAVRSRGVVKLSLRKSHFLNPGGASGAKRLNTGFIYGGEAQILTIWVSFFFWNGFSILRTKGDYATRIYRQLGRQ